MDRNSLAGKDGTMDDKRQILWGMYQEHCTQGRHHESQRSTVTSILLSVSAGGLALVSLDKQVTTGDIPIGLLLIGIGIFGAVFSAKLYERFRMHMKRARQYRDALEATIPDSDLKKLKRKADARHREDETLSNLPLNRLWICINLLVAILGVVVLVLAFCSRNST